MGLMGGNGESFFGDAESFFSGLPSLRSERWRLNRADLNRRGVLVIGSSRSEDSLPAPDMSFSSTLQSTLSALSGGADLCKWEGWSWKFFPLSEPACTGR